MGLLSKSVTVLGAIAGIAIFSQAPEFAQQYRQRLGGALEELRAVVEDFDRDAEKSGMARQQALDEMLAASSGFVRDRGQSMAGTFARYQVLRGQAESLEAAPAALRPLIVLRRPDRRIVEGAREIFEPAVPLTVAGLIYGGAGGLLAAMLARLGLTSAAMVRRGRSQTRPGRGARAGAAARHQKL